MQSETRPPPPDEAAMEADEALFARRGCCCFWIPWSGRQPPSSVEWWERIRVAERGEDRRTAADGDLWNRGVRALMKIREWSEIVAGPRWKTFIRRFKRNPRHGGGRRGWSKFGYDPMSYALNFDEGRGQDESPESGGGFRDFSTRYAAMPGSSKSSMDLSGQDAPHLFTDGATAGVAVH